MIYFRFYGGLGNQMFQYACANEVAEKFNTVVLWNDVHGEKLFEYFSVNRSRHFKTHNRWIRKIIRVYLRLINGNMYRQLIETCNEPVPTIKEQFRNNIYYDGFFQSEQYFSNLKNEISHYFRVKQKYRQEFLNLYGDIFRENKILAIHCRLGDYKNWSLEGLGTNDFSMPSSYYRNALKRIEGIEGFLILIVTDDVAEATSRFSFLPNKKVVSNSSIIDFQVLMNAHQLIIANSTYSWWAGYLNTQASAVYAPEHWLGFQIGKEWPDGVIPEKFIKVPVF